MSKPRISVVTGAAGDIGMAIAKALVQRGDKVIMADICFSEEAVCENVRKWFRDNVPLKTLDISSAHEVNIFVQEIVCQFGHVDCLVNAVGVARVGPFHTLSESDWDTTINVNMKGAFLLSKAIAGPMIDRRWGRIVHVGSTASHTASAGGAIYAASKHGMLGLVRGMACDLTGHGITVNLLSPGNTDTKMLRDVLNERAKRLGRTMEDLRDEIASKTPAGRIGLPKDLAGAAVFLTSDAAEFVSGQSLVVDGGRSLNLV